MGRSVGAINRLKESVCPGNPQLISLTQTWVVLPSHGGVPPAKYRSAAGVDCYHFPNISFLAKRTTGSRLSNSAQPERHADTRGTPKG